MNKTYNIIIDRIKAFADGHLLIASFSHGETDVKDLDKFPSYPHLHVVPESFTAAPGGKQYNIRFLLFDTPRAIEDKSDYQKEVISDLSQILEDFVAEVKNGQTLFGSDADLVSIDLNYTITPFMKSFENSVTGVDCTFGIIVRFAYSACNIPAEWAPSGSALCPNVTVNVDGDFFASVPAGGSINVECGNLPCDDATVENSDDTFELSIPSGGSEILDDYTINTYVDDVLEDTQTVSAMNDIEINVIWN